MTNELLDTAAVERGLSELPGWTRAGNELRRQLEFEDFKAAFAFLTRVALAAEQQDHHPEIRNVYRRVELRLTTHSAGGVTEKDLRLARTVEGFLAQRG